MDIEELKFNQYKLYSEQKEQFTNRSFMINRFYMVMVVVLIPLILLFGGMGFPYRISAALILALIGIMVSVLWWLNMDSYNMLVKIKFSEVLDKMERELPFQPYLNELEAIKAYNKDKQCSFIFTVNGFYTLFSLIAEVQKKGQLNQLPLRLPVYFLAGAEDPVGHYGKDVERIYNCYKELGMKDVTMKLYPGDRHELLNETDKADVYADIVTWLDGHARIL